MLSFTERLGFHLKENCIDVRNHHTQNVKIRKQNFVVTNAKVERSRRFGHERSYRNAHQALARSFASQDANIVSDSN